MTRQAKITVTLGVLVSVILLLSPGFGYAQQSGCEDEAGFDGFDFWLGEWEVTDNITGNRAGSNTIQKMEGGCMLMESWVSVSGGTGTSVNYYNPVNEQWRQLWISEGRYSIDIVGGIENKAMVLTGSIYNFSGGAARFRGTWTPGADGSVRQFFEQYNDETNDWDVWFDGRYVPSQ